MKLRYQLTSLYERGEVDDFDLDVDFTIDDIKNYMQDTRQDPREYIKDCLDDDEKYDQDKISSMPEEKLYSYIVNNDDCFKSLCDDQGFIDYLKDAYYETALEMRNDEYERIRNCYGA